MAESPQNQQPAKRPRHWIRLVLFASLALNLLVFGTLAGAMLGGRPWRAAAPEPAALVRDLGLGPYLRALDQDDRIALRAAADTNRPHLSQGRNEMRQAFTETLAVLRADTFEPTRLLALIQTQAEVAERGRRLGQQLFVERISAMTHDQRLALASRLEDAVRRHGGRHKRGPSKDGKIYSRD